jgi:hypothetical protein
VCAWRARGRRHRRLPSCAFRLGARSCALAGDKSSTLEQEQCIIRDEHFFVRGRLVIPVADATGTEFDWGVWVSLSRDSFTRALSLRATPGREREQPYFGWMSTELPLYQPSTLSLKTRVHTQAVGERPLIELEPTDHPLAVEQRAGITLARVQEIAETLLHALPAPLRCEPDLTIRSLPELGCLELVEVESGEAPYGADAGVVGRLVWWHDLDTPRAFRYLQRRAGPGSQEHPG